MTFSAPFSAPFGPPFGRVAAAAVPITLIYDTFTDVNSTSLDAHAIAPTNVPGTSWTEQVATTWIITSNLLAPGGSTLNSHAICNPGVADCMISVAAKSVVSAVGVQYTCGVVLRWSDINNFWIVGIQADEDLFRIIERNAGTNTTRASASVAMDTVTFYGIVATASGATILATLDGANPISYASATLNQTSTIHGVHGPRVNDRFDNFQVTTI